MSQDQPAERVATFNFYDLDAGDALFVGVTLVRDGLVGLAVSLERDGDYYIFFGRDEVTQLIKALEMARDRLDIAGQTS